MAEIIRDQAKRMLTSPEATEPEEIAEQIALATAGLLPDAFETSDENSLRPRTLEDYLGQEALKEKLHITLEAARRRNEPLDHVLLYGPPGLGKTTMAMILATEMQAPIMVTSAPSLERDRKSVV